MGYIHVAIWRPIKKNEGILALKRLYRRVAFSAETLYAVCSAPFSLPSSPARLITSRAIYSHKRAALKIIVKRLNLKQVGSARQRTRPHCECI